MIDLSRVRVAGPLSTFAAGFADHLTRQGYQPSTARRQMWLLNRLSGWLAGETLGVDELRTNEVERFLRDLRVASYAFPLSSRAMQPILDYLRGLGVAPPHSSCPPRCAIEVFLERYRSYLAVERGVRDASACRYIGLARTFLRTRLLPDGLGLDLRRLTAADLVSFVVTKCPHQSHGTAKLTVSALRSLLGFLHVDGIIDRSLTFAVPSASGRRLVGLPKGLDPDSVQRLLESCHRTTGSGCRDFAVLTMLVRLGLRAGEVAKLRLNDIDWRAGEIVVHGKGNCTERLPLPRDVGEAVAAYLRQGRQATAIGRTVFVRIRPPHGALTTGAVTHMVERVARRCGLGRIHAHRLRHATATMTLRAGASLSEVGQLLRHGHPITTAIYAKVDRDGLRTIARPWPGDVA